MSDEQWHGIAARECLRVARMQARALWRRHGCWCDVSDYVAEALAALGHAVVRYQALPDAPLDAFLPFARQRVYFALVDYFRRGCGIRGSQGEAWSPGALGAGEKTAWHRHEWSWGHGSLDIGEGDRAARPTAREQYVLYHLASERWAARMAAMTTLRWLEAALTPAERRALLAVRLRGEASREYGDKRGLHHATGATMSAVAVAKMRKAVDAKEA